jgi:flagellar FliL protein
MGFIRKFKVAGFILLVICLEMGGMILFFPSTGGGASEHPEAEEAPAKIADEVPSKLESIVTELGESPLSEERAQLVEVDLGEFALTTFQPTSNTTLRIDFHLYGAVDKAQFEDFSVLYEEKRHRFRDQVLAIFRKSEITDLTDAGLGLIKRKILAKTKTLFGRDCLREIIFSDFSFMEQ